MSYGGALCSSISRQRYSGYRPSRVNIMAQGLSTPDPSLSPIHLSIKRGRATTTHYRQGRRHGVESGGGDNFASGASQKFFWTPPTFWPVGGQNIV